MIMIIIIIMIITMIVTVITMIIIDIGCRALSTYNAEKRFIKNSQWTDVLGPYSQINSFRDIAIVIRLMSMVNLCYFTCSSQFLSLHMTKLMGMRQRP